MAATQVQQIVEAAISKESVKSMIIGYNGFLENSQSTNKANMTSLNLGQFDRLRCLIEAIGIDHYGSALLAKEFIKLVNNKIFTFPEIVTIVRNMSVKQDSLRFTQLYLNALNKGRATSSRLALIGSTPIPENVARAIIF